MESSSSWHEGFDTKQLNHQTKPFEKVMQFQGLGEGINQTRPFQVRTSRRVLVFKEGFSLGEEEDTFTKLVADTIDTPNDPTYKWTIQCPYQKIHQETLAPRLAKSSHNILHKKELMKLATRDQKDQRIWNFSLKGDSPSSTTWRMNEEELSCIYEMLKLLLQ